jgi:hypothetical protein
MLPGIGSPVSANSLYVLLKSTSIDDRRTAYLDILKDPDAYSDQILLGIDIWEKTRTQGIAALNKLIYLAAFLKKDEFIEPLKSIASDPAYTEHECIYDCPANFALAVFITSKRWTPPVQMDLDLMSDNGLSLSKTHPGIQFARSEDQELLRKTETLSEEDLILQAAPFNRDSMTRWLVAEVLSHTVTDDKNLIDLYWLALEEIDDASCQYRCAIYRAILRAEMAKAEKGN